MAELAAKSSARNAKPRLTICLVGGTGHGKSESGNTLLGKFFPPHFPTSSGQMSETKELCVGMTKCQDWTSSTSREIDVLVVDTPGWFDVDTGIRQEHAESKLDELASMCHGHIDIFLIIRKYFRFNSEAVQTYNAFKQIFGEEALRHTLWVFTGVENRELSSIRRETRDICKTPQGGAQKAVFDELGGVDRILAMGNLTTRRRSEDRRCVLQAALKLAGENDHAYDHAIFKERRKQSDGLWERVQALREGPTKEMLVDKFHGRGLANTNLRNLHDLVEGAEQEERERYGMRRALVTIGTVLAGATAAVVPCFPGPPGHVAGGIMGSLAVLGYGTAAVNGDLTAFPEVCGEERGRQPAD